MKICIYTFLLILAQGIGWAQGADYKKGTIDLTGNVDLKMVFDGGLRPTQTPGLETLGCQVENMNVTIIFPDHRSVEVLAERGSFDVDANQRLISIDLYGPYEPIDQAINRAMTYVQTLSLDPGNLESLRTDSGAYDHPSRNGWGGTITTSDFRAQLMLRPRYHYKERGADILFIYTAKYGDKPMHLSSTPLVPPRGYENFSMKPLAVHPAGTAFPPLTFEQAKAVGQTTVCVVIALGLVFGAIVVVGLWHFFRPKKKKL